MKQKRKWITIKRERNGFRIKTSTNITGLDVMDMITTSLCKILIEIAKLNSLDVTAEDLAERYKNYMLDSVDNSLS